MKTTRKRENHVKTEAKQTENPKFLKTKDPKTKENSEWEYWKFRFLSYFEDIEIDRDRLCESGYCERFVIICPSIFLFQSPERT